MVFHSKMFPLVFVGARTGRRSATPESAPTPLFSAFGKFRSSTGCGIKPKGWGKFIKYGDFIGIYREISELKLENSREMDQTWWFHWNPWNMWIWPRKNEISSGDIRIEWVVHRAKWWVNMIFPAKIGNSLTHIEIYQEKSRNIAVTWALGDTIWLHKQLHTMYTIWYIYNICIYLYLYT